MGKKRTRAGGNWNKLTGATEAYKAELEASRDARLGASAGEVAGVKLSSSQQAALAAGLNASTVLALGSGSSDEEECDVSTEAPAEPHREGAEPSSEADRGSDAGASTSTSSSTATCTVNASASASASAGETRDESGGSDSESESDGDSDAKKKKKKKKHKKHKSKVCTCVNIYMYFRRRTNFRSQLLAAQPTKQQSKCVSQFNQKCQASENFPSSDARPASKSVLSARLAAAMSVTHSACSRRPGACKNVLSTSTPRKAQTG